MRGRASSNHQSLSATPIELLLHPLIDWTESMTVSPLLHIPPPPDSSSLYLSHSTAKSIKHSKFESQAVLINLYVVLKNSVNMKSFSGLS